MHSEFLLAIRQIEREREIPPSEIQAIVEDALTKAFQQESKGLQSIRVEFDTDTGRLNIFQIREAVLEVENPSLEIDLEDAIDINEDVEEGDLVMTPISLRTFRRIGIQAVKQHIVQRVREMERNIQLERFIDKQNTIITGTVSRITSNAVYVNLDRIDGSLPNTERISGERYSIGKRLKVYITEVKIGGRDSEIVLSRSHPEFVKELFALEVPEIAQHIVLIKEIVREAGYRTKMAVESTQDKVDPVGACVGYKGSRVKNIVNELNGEKIDIIPWDEDPAQFVAHALSPAQVISVEIFDDHSAEVIVPDNQLSLAIGKHGQNARLANKLTGWKIDILSEQEKENIMHELRNAEILAYPVGNLNIGPQLAKTLTDAQIEHVYDLVCMTEEEAEAVEGLDKLSVIEIKGSLNEYGLSMLEPGAEPPAKPAALIEKQELTDEDMEETEEDSEMDADDEIADDEIEGVDDGEVPEAEKEEEIEDELDTDDVEDIDEDIDKEVEVDDDDEEEDEDVEEVEDNGDEDNDNDEEKIEEPVDDEDDMKPEPEEDVAEEDVDEGGEETEDEKD